MTKLCVFGKTVVSAGRKVFTNAFIEISGGKITRISGMGNEPDITADFIFPGFIDPHVHCRDWNQSGKETIRSALEAAAHGGVTRVHDMPNTLPPILWTEQAGKRLELAEDADSPVEYSVYAGLMPEPSQIREAAGMVQGKEGVAGLKLYAGESVGPLSVKDVTDQRLIYEKLSETGYRGILMAHSEKVSMFSEEWSVNHPETWCDTRPPKSETEAVKDQISFATKSGFKGHLHICHASLPETLELVKRARNVIRITCGVTPHHLTLNRDSMKKAGGLYYKVNPPLRERAHQEALMTGLFHGKADWIETDHAPHRINEKLDHPFMSGMPSLDNYSNIISKLMDDFGFGPEKIASITSMNAARLFGLEGREIKEGSEATMTLIDMKSEKVDKKDLRTACNWSPYEGMEFPGRCKATIVKGEKAYVAE